jgi:hypothetical protein
VGWLVVNVLIPVLLPPALLLLARNAPAARRLKLMDTLKDGQLCWFALTLSCATLYDLLENDASQHRVSWCTIAIIGVGASGLLSAVFAVVAAMEPTPLLDDSVGWREPAWRQHYRAFSISVIFVVVVVSFLSLFIHLGLPNVRNP